MSYSIHQLLAKSEEKLVKILNSFAADPTRMAEMVGGIQNIMTEIGCEIIACELNELDEIIRKLPERKRSWSVVRRDENSLLTTIGTVQYEKTLFIHKKTGERTYLLDQMMGLEAHARMTEDVEARILAEAVGSSYGKGGIQASITEERVSKQTVKNKIHELEFPAEEESQKKKAVPVLYIDADEDHISLQGEEKESTISKLIYLYEGREPEAPQSERYKLKGVRYFGGLYHGARKNEELWNEVREYIEQNYEAEQIQKIYVNGDGGGWIKWGMKQLMKAEFVLDGYHLEQQLTRATSHLADTKSEAKERIREILKKGKKKELIEYFGRILDATEEGKWEKIIEIRDYLLENFKGARNRLSDNKEILGSSTEGHVSHVYSERLSSRPLSWSLVGAEKMSKLRVYYYNEGDMLDLVRYQKKATKEKDESYILQLREIIKAENAHRKKLGCLAGLKTYSVPPHISKILYMKEHICGL